MNVEGLVVTYDRHGTELGKLADVFGDPTRRAVYRHLRQAEGPLTATEVGDTFGLHRTVARSHLEKLTELGLVESGKRRRASGGRPAKTYTISAERLEIMLPPRRYERLARLLLRVIDENMPVEGVQEAALALGRLYGEDVSQQLAGGDEPQPMPPAAVLGWLDATGYDVTMDDSDPQVVAVNVHNCVYRELARDYPHIVCYFDRGLLCGMLGLEQSQHRQLKALALGDDHCVHEFRL
jgi:predicted ArsR family transcriptional regulator